MVRISLRAAAWWLPLLMVAIVAVLPAANGYSPFKRSYFVPLIRPESNSSQTTMLADQYLPPGGLEALGSKPIATDIFSTSKGKDAFAVIYQWKVIDFLYPSLQARNNAIRTK